MTERYVTVTEAAEAMGVPTRTVRHWCATGAIPSVQGVTRGKRKIPVAALAEAQEWAAVEVTRAAMMSGW